MLEKHLEQLSQFDKDNGISLPSGRHSEASINKDRDLIISDLMKHHVFEFHKDRSLFGLPKPKSLINNMSLTPFSFQESGISY